MQKKFMRYPAKQTAVKHERIVKEASRLFRELGFEKVSVGEAMKAAGLTHAKSRQANTASTPYWSITCQLRLAR